MSNMRISEVKVIRRVQPCTDGNNIFLSWRNSRGGIEGFLFQSPYAQSMRVTDSNIIRLNPESIENDEAFISVISKQGGKELTLIAPSCDQQTREGLKSILTSPKVKMLTNPLTWDTLSDGVPIGPKWLEVIVSEGRFDMGDSDDDLYDFILTIELQPESTLWG